MTYCDVAIFAAVFFVPSQYVTLFCATAICHFFWCHHNLSHFLQHVLQCKKALHIAVAQKCDILQWCKKCYILRWRKKHVSSNVCTSKCGKFVIYIQFLIQWRWFYPNRLVNSWDILLKLKKMLGFFSIVQVCARIAAYFCFKSRK